MSDLIVFFSFFFILSILLVSIFKKIAAEVIVSVLTIGIDLASAILG